MVGQREKGKVEREGRGDERTRKGAGQFGDYCVEC